MIELTKLPAEQQLDFWLGEWTVTWEDEGQGTNTITRILDDRVIQEQFDGNPTMPFQGLSLSVYNAKRGAWQQTWVDNQGNYWHFEGGVVGNEMILATADLAEGKPIKLRMVFYNIAAQSLDWRWERSDDGGETWQVKWQIHYERRG